MYARGRVRVKGRGRGRGKRWINAMPETTDFRPVGIPQSAVDISTLTLEEFEAIRLVDLEGLQQQEAAIQMGISRKSLWNDLKSGRRKVAMALTHGLAIRIEGGDYEIRGEKTIKG